ncbi:hypothetical protein [Pseudonocardia alaniniphila]|uniref:Excreted virulence factor EspC (Type VII ESX diderm) n=1 Tax=Pseudonocardia alaniniphila TaxID=75291 RepID=A0ABS9TJW0_9PSEU|nr:hypothetical protein [Pseudonocardia alaniniphila]MCH6168688.1 hypothetical protein [Pseudonocardia alaniniphila]
MSAPTDQFIEIANRTQEAVTTAVRTWADTVQTFTGSVTGSRPSLPNAQGAVDRYFDFAEQILESQRRIAKTVLTAGAQAAETMTEQAARTAETVAQRTASATETAVNKAADVGKAAAEQTTATARAARNAADK